MLESDAKDLDPLAKRWQINLRSIFIVITISAAILATVRLPFASSAWTIIIIVAASWLVDRPTLRALCVILMVAYLPYLWLLSLNFYTDSYHRHWLLMWPILPGSLITHFGLRLYQMPDWVSSWASACVALSVIGIATRIGRRGRGWLAAIATVVLLASILSSYICHELFRA